MNEDIDTQPPLESQGNGDQAEVNGAKVEVPNPGSQDSEGAVVANAGEEVSDAVADAAQITGWGEDLEPWDRPVDGSDLLSETANSIAKYVSVRLEAMFAVALWILYSHVYDVFRISPLLGVVSPTKRCGKTNLVSIVSYLVPRPLAFSNMTAASIYRAADTERPTLIADEADTFLKDNKQMRGVLNSGHTKETAFVMRADPEGGQRRWRTWCPKVVAMIGRLPDTLEDRSVVIHMRRCGKDEKTQRILETTRGEFRDLHRKIIRWAMDNQEALAMVQPAIPSELHARAEDNWFPLLAIAEQAGGRWPEEMRKAAVVLSAYVDESTHGEMLLKDIQTVFAEQKQDFVSSDRLVAALTQMEDRPWPEISGSQAISKAKVAAILRPFGIGPKLLRRGKVVARGYLVSDFQDAFARYLAA